MTDIERQGYRAFLSYSHRDGRWAKRLHPALEGYRIDKDLIGRETPVGPVPETLRPIFRDREEFTAGHSLTEQSLTALRASQFLIVICSPAAAKSHYVNEEVRQFKAMGRADAVIPVIVDGEPGHFERECFPPALRFEVAADGQVTDRPTEILAADVREAGDGWGLALAKVIAPLLGLGTDEVYRRSERQRRRQQRVQFAITAVVLVILILGGVFAWQNYQKQQTIAEIEALVAQYAPESEAEDPAPGARQSLTEAIMSIAQGAASDPRYRQALDLLRAGKPAEAEPLLKAVADDKKRQAARQSSDAAEAFRTLAVIAHVSDPANARKYYAEAASLDPEHVEGLLWHGWMQNEAGYLDEARAAFGRVIRLGEEGKDDTWLYWARVGMGDLLVKRGDLNGASAEFGTAKNFAERLAKADPGNAGWQRDLSVAHIKIGDVLVAQGDLPAALESYRTSLGIAERLAKADPGNTGWQRDLSVAQEKIGDVLVAQGDLPGALDSYRASLGVAERLAQADPGNAGWRYDLGISNERIGDVLMAQGKLAKALSSYERKYQVISALAEQDPGNASWQRDLSVAHIKIGDVLVAQGHLPAALDSYRTALGIAKRLTQADPGNVGWQRDLSTAHNKIGDVLLAQGDLPGALDSYRAALATRERLAQSDPGSAEWQYDLGISNERIGDALTAQGKLAEALSSYERKYQVISALAARDPGNAGWQRDLSVAHTKIGDVLGAQGELPGALDSYQAAHAIFERLAQADPGNAGWQRDLIVSHWRLADLAEKAGDGAQARRHWQAALENAKHMDASGRLAPTDSYFVETIEARLAALPPDPAGQ